MARVKVKQRISGLQARATVTQNPPDRTKIMILGLLLFFITVIIYIPAMSAGFIWDDDQEITANQLLSTTEGLHKVWINPPTADYFPLKTTMIWVEYQTQLFMIKNKLFGFTGIQPEPFHVVNILLHAINVVILWRLLLLLEIPAAWFCALIFGIHPVNVESVAWISERKNMLSMLFYLLALIFYVRFDRSKRWPWYIGALAAFLAALLCKTSVVIFPFILLLLAWWWRNEITWKDIVYSAPFLALSICLGVITVLFQNSGQEVIPIGSFDSRFAGAGMAIWFYLSKALVPYNLMEIYPTWDHIHPTLLGYSLNPIQIGVPSGPITATVILDTVIFYLPAILLVAVFCVLFAKRKGRGRVLLFALAYFVLCVLPAIGFFKMSYMRLTLVADHFTYLSIIGVIALVVGGFGYYYERAEESMKPAFYVCAAAVALTFGWMSWGRAAVHRSEKTLWADTLRRNPNTWKGHIHYGAALFVEGMDADSAANQAMAQAKSAEPDTAARLLSTAHQYQQAALRFRAEAKTHFVEAVRLKPENPKIHNEPMLAPPASEGKLKEAIDQYYEAVRIKGNDASLRNNLGCALEQAKRYDEAIVQYQISLKLKPDSAMTHFYLGIALYKSNQTDAAIEELKEALKIEPDSVLLKKSLTAALQQRIRFQKSSKTEPAQPPGAN